MSAFSRPFCPTKQHPQDISPIVVLLLQTPLHPALHPPVNVIYSALLTLCYVKLNSGNVSSAGHYQNRHNMEDLPVKDVFVKEVAAALNRWGLQAPARLFLEAGHPVTFLSGQLLWLAQPALSLLLPSQTVRQAAYLLEEPDAIQALVAQLEVEEAQSS